MGISGKYFYLSKIKLSVQSAAYTVQLFYTMPIKILSTADLHLGRTSSLPHSQHGLSTKTGLDKLVKLAINLPADVLCFSGDIVDNFNDYWEARAPLQEAFNKLREAKISVYLVAGNHDFDVLESMLKEDRNQHVHMLGKNAKWEIITHTAGDMEVQFAGWSFNKQHIRIDPLLSFDRKLTDPDIPVIGLLHCETDMPESKYAPVSTDLLLNSGTDAWLLGHIHKPIILHESAPFVAYAGSPQAMSAGETGVHGALLLTVHKDKRIETEHIPLSPVRYENLLIEIKKDTDENSFRALINEAIAKSSPNLIETGGNPEYMIYDLLISGEHPQPERAEIWAAEATKAEDIFLHDYPDIQVRLRKFKSMIQPAIENMKELAREPSPAGKLAETLLALEEGRSTDFLESLRKDWQEKQATILHSGTYQPLNKTANRQEADKFIMQECKHLLARLMSQNESM